MINNQIIAIDGESYVGKSTISEELATLMGCVYINTGYMYRAVAYKALESKIDYKDQKSIITVATKLKIEFKFHQNKTNIILNDKDITKSLDNPMIVSYASQIAQISELRKLLTEMQRSYAKLCMIIFEGRDIGTIVFPNAHWKFYITASIEVRASRMKKLLVQRAPDQSINVNDLIQKVVALDERDKTRKIAPLRKADDAIIYDNSDSPSEYQDALILQYYINHTYEITRNAHLLLNKTIDKS